MESRYLDANGYLKSKVAWRDVRTVANRCAESIERGEYELVHLEQPGLLLPRELEDLWSLGAETSNLLGIRAQIGYRSALPYNEINRQREAWRQKYFEAKK